MARIQKIGETNQGYGCSARDIKMDDGDDREREENYGLPSLDFEWRTPQGHT